MAGQSINKTPEIGTLITDSYTTKHKHANYQQKTKDAGRHTDKNRYCYRCFPNKIAASETFGYLHMLIA
jgi:hypothetical protein